MSRLGVWLLHGAGVLLSRALPGKHMSWDDVAWIITGSAVTLILHWAMNRQWQRADHINTAVENCRCTGCEHLRFEAMYGP